MRGSPLARLTGGLVAAYLGIRIGQLVAEDTSGIGELLWRVVPPIGLLIVGVLATPYLASWGWTFLQRQVGARQPSTIVLGTTGLFAGLLVAFLLSFPLGSLPTPVGDVMPLAATITLAAAGVAFFVSREDELMQFLNRYAPRLFPAALSAAANELEIVLDTSAIIDGRIADICETGFIQGTLVVPRFVLDELRHIADSPDAVRRNRGRRGLEILSRMQKEGSVPLQLAGDSVTSDGGEVDTRLVRFALGRKAPIITNDFNLNRVAELEGVKVLNVNELANAVKSLVVPGEEMTVRVIQEGKEAGQGVAYLEDGTMIVVENGRRFLNDTAEVVVTRVLQTAAGRMVFAQPRTE